MTVSIVFRAAFGRNSEAYRRFNLGMTNGLQFSLDQCSSANVGAGRPHLIADVIRMLRLELFGVVAYPGTLSPEVERALAALKTNNSVRTETDETIRTSRF